MHGPQWITDKSKWPSWKPNDQHRILSVSTDDVETGKNDDVSMIANTIGLHQMINIAQLKLYLDHENIIHCCGGRINNKYTRISIVNRLIAI